MIIALMGNDGSGKTTIAKHLSLFFKELGFKTVYKHEYEYVVLKYLFKIIGEQNVSKSRKDMLIEKKKSIKFKIWPLLVWFDILLQFVYFKLCKRRTIVILDRYPYDHYMSFKYLGYLTRLTELLYKKFPKPDVGIILYADPNIAYERKKNTHNYQLEFYEKQTVEYINLSKELSLPTINTNGELNETLNKVILLLLKTPLKKQITSKGLQNRVLFSVLKKYKLNERDFDSIILNYKRRQDMFRKSLEFLKRILDYNGIQYCVIKTFDVDNFIGNDIDVLIKYDDFRRLKDLLDHGYYENYVKEIHHNELLDKGKMDIFIKNGLKIDVHSYIGWRNVIYINGEDILNSQNIKEKEFLGIKYMTISDEIDTIIIILAHIFEKGFLTLNEYKFLQEHFTNEVLNSQYLSSIHRYTEWLKSKLEYNSLGFPLFIPLWIILSSYINLLKTIPVNPLWKVKAFFRDIALMVFWRIRYKLKQKLPFEIYI